MLQKVTPQSFGVACNDSKRIHAKYAWEHCANMYCVQGLVFRTAEACVQRKLELGQDKALDGQGFESTIEWPWVA